MSALDIPLGIYVHFPWCVRKCPYCDFNSHPQKGEIPERAYTDQLIADLDLDAAPLVGRPVTSVFLGGGTPSLISPTSIRRLLDGIRECVELDPAAEITLEANPGTVDERHFEGYVDAGVNRLSIGAQSFDSRQLERLGRIHGPAEIERAVATARNAGFMRINLDLMHGLPEQTEPSAIEDIRRALALGVDHISWYQLTLEPRTPFAAHPPTLPDEDTLAAIEQTGFELLRHAGFDRYEISAFAQAEPARHNVNYWKFGDYLGIGAGAHGKLSFATDAGLDVMRTESPKAPERYLKTPAPLLRVQHPVAPADRPGEFMMNALRLSVGVDTATFRTRTGLDVTAIAAQWSRQAELGLMQKERIALTELGRRYLDSVVAAFL
ncbi:MAG: radical SAM family heme chaperone HemW [Gammaproteobacteria bacterium]|nr:radical SAM family heme chaperone HemW [Gammaproteobacteria bacterium]